ncbi:MAG: hypothetical protein Kow0013_14540 [Pararhodobacter sp.]
MSSLLPLTAPTQAPARDAAQGATVPGLRGDTPTRGAETARAPRAVETAQTARDVRAEVARDKPVGPPPAFDINVLQDIRARLVAPPEVVPAEPEAPVPETAEEKATEPAQAARDETEAEPPPPDRAAAHTDPGIRAEGETAHMLDKKV